MSDYDQVVYPNLPQLQKDHDAAAVAIRTDAPNGRGSEAPTSFQAGRNPACEQADMFLDFFSPLKSDHSDSVSESEEKAFLVTPVSRERRLGAGNNAMRKGRLRAALRSCREASQAVFVRIVTR